MRLCGDPFRICWTTAYLSPPSATMAPAKKQNVGTKMAPPMTSTGLKIRLAPPKMKSMIEILDEADVIGSEGGSHDNNEDSKEDDEDEDDYDQNHDNAECQEDGKTALPVTPKSLKRKCTIVEGDFAVDYLDISLTLFRTRGYSAH